MNLLAGALKDFVGFQNGLAVTEASLAKIKKILLSDLHNCRFVFLPKKTTSRRLIEEKFYTSGYMLKVSFEAWSCADIIDCVLLGLGPGIIHDICVPMKKTGLRVVDISQIFGSRDINLVCRKNKFLSKGDQAFMQTILNYGKR